MQLVLENIHADNDHCMQLEPINCLEGGRGGPGSPYRSRPPSERWLLGTAAPGPPSSDRYEPPGGED